jgi:hypothetical protein
MRNAGRTASRVCLESLYNVSSRGLVDRVHAMQRLSLRRSRRRLLIVGVYTHGQILFDDD